MALVERADGYCNPYYELRYPDERIAGLPGVVIFVDSNTMD
jgi:hypothetical protein